MSDGLKDRVRALRDLATIEALLAEGDMVVARVSSRPGCDAPTGQPTPPSTWNREENVADDAGEGLVRRYYEEELNLGRFDRLDDLLTEEFVDHEELRGIPRPATA